MAQAQEDKTASKTNGTKLADIMLMASSAIFKLAAETSTANFFMTNAEKSVSYNTDQQQLIAKLSSIVGQSKNSAYNTQRYTKTRYTINSIS